LTAQFLYCLTFFPGLQSLTKSRIAALEELRKFRSQAKKAMKEVRELKSAQIDSEKSRNSVHQPCGECEELKAMNLLLKSQLNDVQGKLNCANKRLKANHENAVSVVANRDEVIAKLRSEAEAEAVDHNKTTQALNLKVLKLESTCRILEQKCCDLESNIEDERAKSKASKKVADNAVSSMESKLSISTENCDWLNARVSELEAKISELMTELEAGKTSQSTLRNHAEQMEQLHTSTSGALDIATKTIAKLKTEHTLLVNGLTTFHPSMLKEGELVQISYTDGLL